MSNENAASDTHNDGSQAQDQTQGIGQSQGQVPMTPVTGVEGPEGGTSTANDTDPVDLDENNEDGGVDHDGDDADLDMDENPEDDTDLDEGTGDAGTAT